MFQFGKWQKKANFFLRFFTIFSVPSNCHTSLVLISLSSLSWSHLLSLFSKGVEIFLLQPIQNGIWWFSTLRKIVISKQIFSWILHFWQVTRVIENKLVIDCKKYGESLFRVKMRLTSIVLVFSLKRRKTRMIK